MFKASFLFLFSLIVLFIATSLVANSFVIIEADSVGVLYEMGVLNEQLLEPGLYFTIPILEVIYSVPVITKTSHITNVPCYTVNGMKIEFNRIDIVNKIIKAQIIASIKKYGEHFEEMLLKDNVFLVVHSFCKTRTLEEIFISQADTLQDELTLALTQDLNIDTEGIYVNSVIVYKPEIPDGILAKYKEIEEEKIRYALLMQKSKGDKIENELNEERSRIEYEKVIAEAEAMKEKLTPQFLQYEMMQTIKARKENNVFLLFSDELSKTFSESIFGTLPLKTLPFSITDNIDLEQLGNNTALDEFSDHDEECIGDFCEDHPIV